MIKNLPAMWETWVRSLGQEDTLEKGMETHSSILAWGIPWTEKPGGLQSMELYQFSQSVVSDSLQPHEPQHTRPPHPSPTPGVYPNSCPLSW